jgi:hypothetical protein
MRRRLPIAILVVVAALAVASTASARFGHGIADSDIELADGSGRVLIAVRGALIGSLGDGRLTITAKPLTEVLVQGAESSFLLDEDTTVYVGENIRFRAFRGRIRVRIQGTEIFTSLVGSGAVWLAGQGTYSLAGTAPKPWPEIWSEIKLGDDLD